MKRMWSMLSNQFPVVSEITIQSGHKKGTLF